MLKSIPTVYNGTTFRSRLEARWAYYFDLLGLKWYYEYEGFVLNDGTKYVPDFYIPGFGYIEIKPDNGVTEESIRKCKMLSNELPIRIVTPTYSERDSVAIFEGNPSLKQQRHYKNGEEYCSLTYCYYSVKKWGATPFFGEVEADPEDIINIQTVNTHRWY